MIDDLICKIELRSLTQILKQNSIVELTSITCRAKFGDERCKMPLDWYTGTVASVGDEIDRTFSIDPYAGLLKQYTNALVFTGDGATTAVQLKNPDGLDITADYVIAELRVGGVATTDYTDDGAGMLTFDTAPETDVQVRWDGTVKMPAAPDGFFVPGVVQWVTGDNEGRENEIEEYAADTMTATFAIPAYKPIVVGDTFMIRRDCDKSKAMCKDYGNLLNMRAEPELPRADGTALQVPGGG